MNGPSDAELMRRVQEGDLEAFAPIVERYQDLLVNYLSRMSGCRDRANELAQEAFVRLFEKSGQYREQGQLGGYLLRIATNLLRSQERRAVRWRLLAVGYAANGMGKVPSPLSPQRQLLAEEATAEVTAALKRLPIDFRAPLVLREIEGWSYREIAGALGCREGTVKSRISRGKQRLRRLLAPYWNGAGR